MPHSSGGPGYAACGVDVDEVVRNGDFLRWWGCGGVDFPLDREIVDSQLVGIAMSPKNAV